jgi:signal transduction histidine kinase
MSAQFKDRIASVARRYGLAIAAIMLALLLRGLLAPIIGAASPQALMLTAVAIGAWYGGVGPGAVAAIIAALAANALALPSTSMTGSQLGIFLVEGLSLSVLIGMLQARLRHAEAALRARDDLLAVAAHEFKTPLTSVIGYTRTLQMRAAREGHLPRRDLDTLRVIVGQAKRLHALIDSVLDLARLDNGQARIARQAVDVAALARRLVDDARLIATRQQVEFHGPDAPVIIMGDSVRMEQVLQNLLDNAVKYSPDDGVITVGVEQRHAEAVLTVSDQGIGIPEAARARLFERFYRANNLDSYQMPGTGIGLSIVNQIVTLHGGVLQVASAEGQGSTFTVRLPLAKADATAQSTQEADPGQSAPAVGAMRPLKRPMTKNQHEHIY